MQFEVRALSTDEAVATLSTCVIDGRDEADARRQAEARGLFVSAIRPLRATPFSAAGRSPTAHREAETAKAHRG